MWPQTVAGAQLRVFFVEWMSLAYAKEAPHGKETNGEFLRELCTRLYRRAWDAQPIWGQEAWKSLDLCKFHLHNTVDCTGKPLFEDEIAAVEAGYNNDQAK